jgi:endogenous inhibitor of DNA gyrase (YacG/DUF329 family)
LDFRFLVGTVEGAGQFCPVLPTQRRLLWTHSGSRYYRSNRQQLDIDMRVDSLNKFMDCPHCGGPVPFLSRAWANSRDMKCPNCERLVDLKWNARKFFVALGVVAAAGTLLFLAIGHSAVSYIVPAAILGPLVYGAYLDKMD